MSKNVVFGIIVGLLLGVGLGYGITTLRKDSGSAGVSMSGMNHGAVTESASLESLSGDAYDKRFVELMIEHHQGAIDMANLSDSRAKHQEIKTLSDDIVSAQAREIEMMKSWLKQWGY